MLAHASGYMRPFELARQWRFVYVMVCFCYEFCEQVLCVSGCVGSAVWGALIYAGQLSAAHGQKAAGASRLLPRDGSYILVDQSIFGVEGLWQCMHIQ